jgi:putative lipase involved disintegration of autophagic bodies
VFFSNLRKESQEMLQAFRGFVFLLCLIPFVGCMKKVEYVETSSGRPEVTIRKGTKASVFEYLVAAMRRKGYEVKLVKAPIVEFAKRTKTKEGAQEGRVRFKLAKTAFGTRIVTSVYRISNPGRSTEKITDISKDSKDARGLQGMLERIKDDLESYRIKSF